MRDRAVAHPYLVGYLVAFAVVWTVTAATWTVRADALDLHPLAQALQYLLVVIAATLAALRLRIERPGRQSDAGFGFYDYRWQISDTVDGTSLWTAIGIGVVAMATNIALLIVADVAVAGAAGAGSYVSWVGAGIGAGAVIGMFSAVLALLIGSVIRLVRLR